MDQEQRVARYIAAVRGMRDGSFESGLRVDEKDRSDPLGRELDELADVLRSRSAQAEKLAAIAEDVGAGLVLDDVLNRVFERFREVIPYDRIGCALLSEDRRLLTARWARSDAPQVRIAAGFAAPMQGSSLERILVTRRPRIINDLEVYLREHPASVSTRLIVEEGMRSSMTCPLVVREDAVGFLFFSSLRTHTYRAGHQETFVQIARELSTVIDKAQRYEQLHEAHEMLRQEVVRDSLTGLLNHGAIVELLHRGIAEGARHGWRTGTVMIDIDSFKKINDTYGHLTGDVVLREIARRLDDTARRSDGVGRYGGEEFMVVLSNVTLETAVSAAERLRAAVNRGPVLVDGRSISVSVSMGVAVAQEAARSSAPHLLAAADQRLYEAKSNGRNRVVAAVV